MEHLEQSQSEQNQDTGGQNFIERMLAATGRNLFKFAVFSGMVCSTRLEDFEYGLCEGGLLHANPDFAGYAEASLQPRMRFENAQVSCFYFRTDHAVDDRSEIRESVDIVRRGMSGGAFLYFTDGVLVGGIVNGFRRTCFSENELQVSARILEEVRSEYQRISNLQ